MTTNVRLVDDYNERTHRLGRITGMMALTLIFAIPAIICLRFNIFPPIKNLLTGIIMICVLEIPICIAEVLTYTPMLGSGASYLAFVTGNLTNLKVPCATLCMEIADVKPCTKEAEIIATISVAVSTIVTEIIIIIGLLAIVPLTPILQSPTLAPAFENILPALFGALGGYWLLKEWKLAVTPLAISVMVSLILPVETAILIPLCALSSIGAARYLYKKGLVKEI